MDENISFSDIRNENTQQSNGLLPYKARYSHCKIKGVVLTNDLESLITVGM